MAKKQFKAESKKLLDLMINSIYTNREIFLRELISNASDAIDKLCYIALTDDTVGLSREDFRIRVTADKDARTLTVSDNGVGMTRQELEENLGVIAHSGSQLFKKDALDRDDADMDIIGQFGVGFYSAFMVADKVSVLTRAHGGAGALLWESSGADGYTIREAEKEGVGTDVTLHLKPDTEDEKYSEFLESWKLQELVKKYSDYVRWPIRMEVEDYRMEPTGETDEKGNPKTEYKAFTEEKTVNSMVPIWQRAKSEVSDEDCGKFYMERFHDWEKPLRVIRVSAEGLVSFKAMLFIPSKAPFNYYSRDWEAGLALYSSGVLIMDKCADLLPECFAFVRGVVDSPDLSLNISRELLQHDRQLKVIANSIEKKIKAELKKLMDEDAEQYKQFWGSFGRQLKYGVVSEFGAKKELLRDLLLFHTSNEAGLTDLKGYVARMPAEQQKVYYAAGETVERAALLPQAEPVKARGWELLYLCEEVDEFVLQALENAEGKPFCNVSTEDLGLKSDAEKEETKAKQEKLKPALEFIQEKLGDAVAEVRLSDKLQSMPVCLSTDGEVTLEMERYFARFPETGGGPIKARRILELNGEDKAVQTLFACTATDPERAEKMAKILLAQANLLAGLPLDDPQTYTKLVCELFPQA
jgi:molecular chaperone HtpG